MAKNFQTLVGEGRLRAVAIVLPEERSRPSACPGRDDRSLKDGDAKTAPCEMPGDTGAHYAAADDPDIERLVSRGRHQSRPILVKWIAVARGWHYTFVGRPT